MLELRPNCELCDADLPPDCSEARICSYECTYCLSCAETRLRNVCPTCGGGFTPRPIRPARAWRAGLNLGLGAHPAATERTHSRWTPAEIDELVGMLWSMPPEQR